MDNKIEILFENIVKRIKENKGSIFNMDSYLESFSIIHVKEQLRKLFEKSYKSKEKNQRVIFEVEDKLVVFFYEKPKIDFTKEKIQEEIAKGVEAVKNEDIVSLFSCLCAPFDDGKGAKEAIILGIFKELDIEASYVDKIGIVIPAKKEKKRVVTSHIDLIPLFNKGFQRERKYFIDNENIYGALDNTITNAIAMIAAYKTSSEETEFVFTEGEETGFWGMKEYIKNHHNEELFYINLDVTNDNWKAAASVEYDNPNHSICIQMKKECPCKTGMTIERVCDDLDVVVNKNGHGFSYCLPTKKTIHSYKNYTKLKKLTPYLNGLLFCIEELNLEDKTPDFKYTSIKEAIKLSKEELKEKEEKAKKELESIHSSRSYTRYYSRYDEEEAINSHMREITADMHVDSKGQSYFDFGGTLVPTDDESLQGFAEVPPEDYFEDTDIVTEKDIFNLETLIQDCIHILKHNGVKTDKYIEGFISEKVVSQEQWSIDDLAGHISNLDLAQEILLILDDNYLLTSIDNGVYRFPNQSPF